MHFLRALSCLVGLTSLASAASLQQVSNFGTNPTGVQMYIYVPDKVAASPPIIVGLHPCGGSAQQWYSSSKMPQYADQQGFILIYAGTTRYQNCWDVNNAGSLTHNGSGDALGIVSMVKYALQKYNGDASRVWVFGGSSGAMMTNVMAGSYPDIFEAGAVYAGVAHACFFGSKGDPTPSGSNQTCARGLQHTPQEWANFVYNSFPGYSGRHTRMQIWHGGADTLVLPQCAVEQTKQWSQVHGLAFDSTTSNSNNPSSGWTQTLWGDGKQVVKYTNPSVGHFPAVNEQVMLAFFSAGGGSTGTQPTTTAKPPPSSSAPSGGSVTTTPPATSSPPSGGCTTALYGQCGGNGFSGCSTCASGSKCVVSNPYYSQCLPA